MMNERVQGCIADTLTSNQIKSREILESIGFSRFDIFRYVIK